MTTLGEKHRAQVLAWTSRTCREDDLPEYWIYPIWPIRIRIFRTWSWWRLHFIETCPPVTFQTVFHLGFVRIIIGPER